MSTHLHRNLLHALPLFAAGVLLAACGGNGAAHTHAGSVDQRATVALRDFARCVRAHGLPDFPDPQVGSDGVPRLPDSAPDVPGVAQRACRAAAARIPARFTETQPVPTADFEKLLRLARCMRVHGLPDWPDPNPLGQFPIDGRIEHGGKQLLFSELHACARLNPDPNGGIDVVRAQPSR
jgi:hypothetical protein